MAARYLPNNDNFYQEVRVYIEGVQIPWDSVSVFSAEGQLPTATITVPPSPGLMDIARYYQPKIHIFFQDIAEDPTDIENAYKVLFTGVIQSMSYAKSKGVGAGTSLTFACVHKNYVMDDIVLAYTGRGMEGIPALNKTDAPAVSAYTSSAQAMLLALRGITKGGVPPSQRRVNPRKPPEIPKNPDTSYLPAAVDQAFYERLQGVPGILVNLWNQIVSDSERLESNGISRSQTMVDMYIPLVEHGLQYWQRLSGHPLIESAVEGDRHHIPAEIGEYDESPGKKETKDRYIPEVIFPPAFKVYVGRAVGAYLAQMVSQSAAQYSNEQVSFSALTGHMLEMFMYARETLASPTMTELGGIETVVKPFLDFYYAPACNIIFPTMYESLSIGENTISAPTRIIAVNSMTQVFGPDSMPLSYRAPQSVRAEIAKVAGTNLKAGLTYSWDRVGPLEWSRGVKPLQQQVPEWMNYVLTSLNKTDDSKVAPVDEPDAQQSLAESWALRMHRVDGTQYPNKLNPYHEDSGLNPGEMIMVSYADYMYAKSLADMRQGSVSGVFNPYVVPGYPMDILAKDTHSQSFHAVCTTVTHSINAGGSLQTDIGFRAAMSFEELYSYYMPASSPWLFEKLGLDRSLCIVGHGALGGNDEAIAKAHEYYAPVLGCGASIPEHVYNYERGYARPVQKVDGLVVPLTEFQSDDPPVETSYLNPETGNEENPNVSTLGGLLLAHRPIETMASIQESFGYQFIHITDEDASDVFPSLLSINAVVTPAESLLREHGENLYLDYWEMLQGQGSQGSLSGRPSPLSKQINPNKTEVTPGRRTAGSRGIRNNNPGNLIDDGKTQWQGLDNPRNDGRFLRFKTPEDGIRAMAKTLQTYEKNGVSTLGDAIRRYAPPNENNTDEYINRIAGATGINPDQRISLSENLDSILPAMIHMENGSNPYTSTQIQTGINAAGGG